MPNIFECVWVAMWPLPISSHSTLSPLAEAVFFALEGHISEIGTAIKSKTQHTFSSINNSSPVAIAFISLEISWITVSSEEIKMAVQRHRFHNIKKIGNHPRKGSVFIEHFPFERRLTTDYWLCFCIRDYFFRKKVLWLTLTGIVSWTFFHFCFRARHTQHGPLDFRRQNIHDCVRCTQPTVVWYVYDK